MAAGATVPPELPKPVATVLRCITRSAQLALRAGAHLQVVNAAIQLWNVLRALSTAGARVLTAHYGSAAWTLKPPAAAEEDVGAGRGTGTWSCTAAPASAARLTRPLLDALLDAVEAVKAGAATLATAPQPVAPAHAARFPDFPAPRPRTPGAPRSERYDGSVLSLGSDAPRSAWMLEDTQLDYALISRIVVVGMGALVAGGRPAAALATGRRWAVLSDGAFDEAVMPACLVAAPRAGEDVQPFAAALSAVLVDKRDALCLLDAARHSAAVLGARDALVVASDVLRPPRRGAAARSHPGSGARSTAAKSLRSGVSRASTVDASARAVVRALQPACVQALRCCTLLADCARPVQSQYEEVIKALQAAGETHAQALACHELGDVHLQQGDAAHATSLWNDALDIITGPYQVQQCARMLQPCSVMRCLVSCEYRRRSPL
jgi:hypothetical protein